MKTRDIKYLKKIIGDREDAHKFYSRYSKTYNGFLTMENVTYKDGHLKKMYKELIAVGISVRINCESCMEWHIKQALDSGATREQIIEAIDVGIEMGGGPATVSSRFAMKVLEYYTRIPE